MANNISQSEIYFKRVTEPEIGKIYFQFEGSYGYPVMIIDGKYYADNGRLSNAWTWRNLHTGERESGYGCFYVLKEYEE